MLLAPSSTLSLQVQPTQVQGDLDYESRCPGRWKVLVDGVEKPFAVKGVNLKLIQPAAEGTEEMPVRHFVPAIDTMCFMGHNYIGHNYIGHNYIDQVFHGP